MARLSLFHATNNVSDNQIDYFEGQTFEASNSEQGNLNQSSTAENNYVVEIPGQSTLSDDGTYSSDDGSYNTAFFSASSHTDAADSSNDETAISSFMVAVGACPVICSFCCILCLIAFCHNQTEEEAQDMMSPAQP